MLNSLTSSRRSALIYAGLIAISVVAIALRLTAIAEPLGIDQSLWASAVRGMARGQHLYQDAWEQRPPGIYFTYLAAFSVLGWKTSTVAWMDVIATALTAFFLYRLARRLSGSMTAALASALYTALTMPAWIYRNGGILERSVCETFIGLCVAAGALCADSLRRRSSLGMGFLFGALMSAAALYKPNAALYFPALLLWALRPDASQPIANGFRARAIATGIGGALLLPACTFLWLWNLGLIGEARTAIVDFNRWYVSQGFTLSGYVVKLANAIHLRLMQDPLWVAGAVATLAGVWHVARTKQVPAIVSLSVIWGAAATAVIAVNGMWLFNTYFMNPLAPLALFAAWWLHDAFRGPRLKMAFGVVTLLMMGWLLYQRNYVPKLAEIATLDLQYMTGRMDRSAYLERFGGYNNDRGYSARGNEEMSLYVRAHTTPDDQIYLFGINGAGVYFLSDRLAANRFLRANFFVPDGFPDPRFTLGAVIDELRAKRPAYVIFERLHSESEMGVAVDALQEHPLVRSLLDAYELDARIEDFTLYRRK